MWLAFAVLLAIHSLIHLIGLTRPHGVLWLTAAVLFAATTVTLFLWPRWWWALGFVAVAVSTMVIALNWSEARAGTAVNAVALIGVVAGFLVQGPFSLRAQFDNDVRGRIGCRAPDVVIGDQNLVHLPNPIRRYLVRAGVVGEPLVRSFHVRMHGRIRSGPDAPWMPIAAEQYSVADPPARFFYLTGSMRGIPVYGFHRYSGSTATMVVKAAAIMPVVRASGPDIDRAETVTMFNDMCVLAPATLVDPAIQWTPIDDRRVLARFTNGAHSITAKLVFNDQDELVNFLSEDRAAIAADGRARTLPWSTPVGEYRMFGAVRLPSRGEGRWYEPAGDYAYIELTIDDVRYNQ